MKRIIYLIFLVFLFSLTSTFAEKTVVSPDELFRFTLLGHSPSPIQPGVPTEFKFQVNYIKQGEIIAPFEVSFVPSFPFSINPGENLTKSLGRFVSGETKSFSFMAVPSSSATNGSYDFSIQYYSPLRRSLNPLSFSVDISPLQADLSNTKISLYTDGRPVSSISPGERAELRIYINNFGTYALRDLSLSLDFSDDDIPFAPIDGTSERKISSIPLGSSSEASFKIIALPDANGGVYKIPLSISYYDTFGTLIEKSDLVSLVISSPSDVVVLVDDSQLYAKGPGILSLRFVNRGLTDIKFLTVSLLESKQYDILGSPQEYIGDLDSDDYELAEFRIDAKKKHFDILVSASFKDAQNIAHEVQYIVPFTIRSKQALGLEQDSNIFAWLLFIVLFLFFVMHYRRWKRSHEDLHFDDYLSSLWRQTRLRIARLFRKK